MVVNSNLIKVITFTRKFVCTSRILRFSLSSFVKENLYIITNFNIIVMYDILIYIIVLNNTGYVSIFLSFITQVILSKISTVENISIEFTKKSIAAFTEKE